MPNVIRLRGRPTHASASATPVAVSLVASETINRMVMMHSIAKNRLQTTLSLLDMTFLNIRHLSTMIADPDIRAVVDRELASLEAALASARVRALEL